MTRNLVELGKMKGSRCDKTITEEGPLERKFYGSQHGKQEEPSLYLFSPLGVVIADNC